MKSPTRDNNLLDGLPPQNLEAEQDVLGSLIASAGQMCDDVALVLRPADFYRPANQTLYTHLLAMHNDGLPIDAPLLIERLNRHNELEAIGGLGYLAQVADSVPTGSNAVYYAQIVAQKAALRGVIHAATEALRDAYDGEKDSGEVIADLQAKLDRTSETNAATDPIEAPVAIAAAVERIHRLAETKRAGGLITGFPEFDSTIGGLFPGELVILAARPRVGKTALATQLATRSGEQGERCLFVSLEMSATELATRMLCGRGQVDGGRLRTGRASAEDLARIDQAAEALRDLPFLIDDRAAMSVADIRSQARRMRSRGGLGLVIIDYLQRVSPADQRLKRYEQVGEMARGLKRLARELNIPVVVLAQLSREADATAETRPQLRHLRESGDIEAEADVVAFLHRPELIKPGDLDLLGKAELIVEKNRNGPTATFSLEWDASTTTFRTPRPASNYCWEEAVRSS
ncbi:MAG TPA: replicative DNA helicase [Pirellulales bacterium]|nr:replicative DNA helicase [Pirellulales bacterium]